MMNEEFGDFGAIPQVAAAAVGALGNELTFTVLEVLDVVKVCSSHLIAVLGIDLFLVLPDGLYQTEKLSGYDLRLKESDAQQIQSWTEYVKLNNAAA